MNYSADEEDTESAQADCQTSFETWRSASDRPWVVPDLRAAFPPSTGPRWHYYLSLAGYTYRLAFLTCTTYH